MANQEHAGGACDHKYVHLRSEKTVTHGSYNSTFTRTEVFFCERCLDEKRKVQSESSRGEPAFWLAP